MGNENVKLTKTPYNWQCLFQSYHYGSQSVLFVQMFSNNNKLASLDATLVQSYDRPTVSLTGVKCKV